MKPTPEQRRRWNLKKFGLTPEQYDGRLKAQKGRCAICGRIPPIGRRLAVDHDHKTGKVRGLLCGQCNVALGLFEDNARYLTYAIGYLKNGADYDVW